MSEWGLHIGDDEAREKENLTSVFIILWTSDAKKASGSFSFFFFYELKLSTIHGV